MAMEGLEQQIKQIIYSQLFVAERQRQYGCVCIYWGLVRRALEQLLIHGSQAH